MLLELPKAVLSQMLQDEAILTAALEKALKALQAAPKSRYNRLENRVMIPFIFHFYYLRLIDSKQVNKVR